MLFRSAKGTTVIVVTHEAGNGQEFDRVIQLKDGEISTSKINLAVSEESRHADDL